MDQDQVAKEAEQKRYAYEQAQEVRQILPRPEPPPPWDACGIEEKLERVRVELLNLRRSYPLLAQTVYRLDADFQDHFHTAAGAPALPLRRSGIGILGQSQSVYDPLA